MVNIAEPCVTLVASTTIEPGIDQFMDLQWQAEDAESVIEFAGRACYQSFSRPNPATANTDAYLRRTLFDQGHWSIAEHASATFYITGVSRAFTHELVRHRHLSYSQLSQRFVDESSMSVVVPPALRSAPDTSFLCDVGDSAVEAYDSIVSVLSRDGLSRKQAREAARAVLPNMTETRIVVTGNLRAWHEFCARRMQPDADAEIQQIAGMIYKQLGIIAPSIFPGTENWGRKIQERKDLLNSLPEGSIVDVDGRGFALHGLWIDITKPAYGPELTAQRVAELGSVKVLYTPTKPGGGED